MDYLLKPVRFERFVIALGRAQRMREVRTAEREQREEGHLFVKSGYGSVRIDFPDILYIEGVDDYLRIHFTGNRNPLLSQMSLRSMLEQLPPGRFMRVHRSYIVALRHILSVRKKTIRLSDSTQLPVGDTYAGEVNAWLGGKSEQ